MVRFSRTVPRAVKPFGVNLAVTSTMEKNCRNKHDDRQVFLQSKEDQTNDIKLDDTQIFFSLFFLFLYCADFWSVFARADLLTVTVLYSLSLAQLTVGG